MTIGEGRTVGHTQLEVDFPLTLTLSLRERGLNGPGFRLRNGEFWFVNIDTMLQFWLPCCFNVQGECRCGGIWDVFQRFAVAEGTERFDPDF